MCVGRGESLVVGLLPWFGSQRLTLIDHTKNALFGNKVISIKFDDYLLLQICVL